MRVKNPSYLLLGAVLAVALLGTTIPQQAAAAEQQVSETVAKMEKLKAGAKYAEVIALGRGILKVPPKDPRLAVRAAVVLADAYNRDKKVDQACETWQWIIDTYPGEKKHHIRALDSISKYRERQRQYARAAETVRNLLEKYTLSAKKRLPYLLRLASLESYHDKEKGAAVCESALEEYSADKAAQLQILFQLASIRGSQKDERALEIYSRIVKEFPQEKNMVLKALIAKGRLLESLGRKNEAEKEYRQAWETLPESDTRNRITVCQRLVSICAAQGNSEDAESIALSLVTPGGDVGSLMEAVNLLYQIYMQKEDYDRALFTARVTWDLSMTDARRLSGTVNKIFRTYKAKYSSLAQANAFLAFVKDLQDEKAKRPSNPLLEIHRPELPKWDEHFGKALDSVERGLPGWAASTRLCLAWGKPAQALEFAMRYYRACDRKSVQGGADLVVLTLRALTGGMKAANDFYLYQEYGPAGKDGREGTADDLEDPVAKLLAEAKRGG